MAQYERAVALFTQLYGEAAEPTLMALDRLSWTYLEEGRVDEALAMSRRVRALWESQLPPGNLALLMARVRVARIHIAAGNYAEAERELRAVINDAATVDPSIERSRKLFQQWLGIDPDPAAGRNVLIAYAGLLLGGSILEETGEDLTEAESRLRESLSLFVNALGDSAELTALTQLNLAIVLGSQGQTKEAEEHAMRVRRYSDSSLPDWHYANALSRLAMGRVRLEQQRFGDAASQFQEAVNLCTRESGCSPRMRVEFLLDLGIALNENGRWRAALEALQSSLTLQQEIRRPGHAVALRTQIALADAFLQAEDLEASATVLSTISTEAVSALRRYQQSKADLRRVEGLLLLRRGERERAALALQESLEILSHRLGNSHWRTKRAKQELARAR